MLGAGRNNAMSETIDLNAAIERRGVGRLAILVMVLCFAMMFADGYDFAALSVATPAILREWHLGPKDMGAVFSITFVGLLVGSLFYGWLGDRLGRRFTIIFGTFNFALPTLLIVWAGSLLELKVLRFLGGVGMGGIVPIAYTVVSEYAPRRMRSTVTVITQAGYSLGAAATGLVAAWAVARYGWQSLFTLGASASLAMAVVLILFLPESALFLAMKKPDSPQLLPLARRLLRGETIDPATRFTARDPQEKQSVAGQDNLRQLFAGPRAWATLLLWLLFVSDSLGFFFLASWLPVVMEGAGVAPATASLTQSLFVFAGMAGGFGVMRFIDVIGPIAVVALPLVGGPLELVMGVPGLPEWGLLAAVAGAGVCLSGIHYAVYAIVVRFYPPAIRGRGVSSATVWGRAGGIVAPLVGGYLLSAHMPLEHLMMFAAAPCIVTAIVGLSLGRVYRRHFDLPVAAA
jgi:AAHS family 4-hydroxybenzoate transporter-like MFS transporter